MSLPTPPPHLAPALSHIQIPLSRTYSFPLTPSPNSPFRAHRPKHQHQAAASSGGRPKPYHRPQSEFQCHAAGPVVLGTADAHTNPSSSSPSSHESAYASPYHHHPHLTSVSSRGKRHHHHHHQHHHQVDARTAALARSQSLLDGDAQQKLRLQQPTPGLEEEFAGGGRPLMVWYQDAIKTEPPMDATVPAPLPYSFTSSQHQHQSDGLQASPQALTVPIFAPTPENQAPLPPLVFPAEYIEEHVAKYLGNDSATSAAPPIGRYQAPAGLESFSWLPPSASASSSSSSQSSISRQSTLIAFSDSFSSYLPTPASSFGAFPYVSTYVPASAASSIFIQYQHQQCPYRSNSVASTVVGSDNGYYYNDAKQQQQRKSDQQCHQKRLKTVEERMAEEKRKQRYAMELIETAIASIHKIWPETREPDAMYIVNPVTRNGELRTSASPTRPQPSSSAAFTSKFAHLRRDTRQQQLTPDSSPTFDVSARKRKHGEIAVKEEPVDDPLHAVKKRSVGEGAEARSTVTIPIPICTADADAAPVPTQGQHHTSPITLRLFVRELLRRSKTSCSTLEVALCYLDGIEDTVRKLKDCVKLGIAFGTAAMAERGPYDEGMKDEGRIIKLDEFVKMQFEEASAAAADAMMMLDQEEWTPVSPESDASGETKSSAFVGGGSAKTSKTLQPSSTQVLSTHPLLDARRTFLAALVLATKFIQDKAYSNKAWAKLSGLAGREVGRCERALGGALGWRLWVGKDYDGTSVRGHHSRPTTPTAGEPVPSSLDSDGDSVVHGEDDAVAKAFMAEAMVAGEMAAKARAILALTSASNNSMEAMVIPPAAPALLAPAQAAVMAATRAGCGRARTWPSIAVDTSMLDGTANANLGPLSAPLASAFNHLSENFAAVHLQSAAVSAPPVESHGSWLDRFLEHQGGVGVGQHKQQQDYALGGRQQPSTGTVPHNDSSFSVFGPSILHHSPLPLDHPTSSFEDNDGGVKTEPATPATVRITVDDVDATAPGEGTPLATPYLAMAGSFGFSDPSTPPTGFIEPWQSMATYPFTFNLASQQQQQWPAPAQATQQQHLPSLSQLLLHPQTAALRGYSNGVCGGGNSYSSPTSVSTLSSPEVLTPVHSRAPTLVDGMEYARSLLRPPTKSVSMPMPVSANVYQGMDLSAALLGGYHGHQV